MKNELITNEEVLANDNTLINLKHALVTEIELKNGKKTQIVTFFNFTELSDDAINFGVKTGLEHSKNVVNMQSTLCSFKTGVVKPFMFFDKNNIVPYDPNKDSFFHQTK